MNIKLIVLVVLIFLLGSCSSKIKDYITFNSPTVGSVVLANKEIKVELDIDKDTQLEQITYLIDGKVFATKRDAKYVLLPSDNLKFGIRMLSAIVKHSRGIDTLNSNFILKPHTQPKLLKYKLINTFPHDTSAYTQGLSFVDGKLLESTGRLNQSKLKWVNLQNGKDIQSVDLPGDVFGEGSVKIDDKIIVLTWENKMGLIYDSTTLKELGKFPYDQSTEGWGLSYDGKHIWKSDGSHRIWRLNTTTFKEEDYIEVFDNKGEVENINELEYIGVKLFANIYTSNRIIIINPKNGLVEGEVDLSALVPKDYFTDPDDKWNCVLNGIAYHPTTHHLFVTGKKWPKLFEIEIENLSDFIKP